MTKSKNTRYFLDTEFVDNGQTIDLISIGLVAEDGREPYLESADFDEGKANQWVRDHVLPWLTGGQHRWPVQSIRATLLDFFDPKDYGKPELWSWCGCYDFVVLCQIFGTMMDLPPHYPHYVHDLQYLLDEKGISDESLSAFVPQPANAHNALVDALYIKKAWEFLQQVNSWGRF